MFLSVSYRRKGEKGRSERLTLAGPIWTLLQYSRQEVIKISFVIILMNGVTWGCIDYSFGYVGIHDNEEIIQITFS